MPRFEGLLSRPLLLSESGDRHEMAVRLSKSGAQKCLTNYGMDSNHPVTGRIMKLPVGAER